MNQTEQSNDSWFYTETPVMEKKDFQLLMELIGFDNFQWVYYVQDEDDKHQAYIRINEVGTKRLANYVESYQAATKAQEQ